MTRHRSNHPSHPRSVRRSGVCCISLLLLSLLPACGGTDPTPTTQPLLALPPTSGGSGCTVRWSLPWPELPDGALRWEDCLRPDQPVSAANHQRVRLLSGETAYWSHEVGRPLPCAGGWWTDPTPARLTLPDGRVAVEITGKFGGLPCKDGPTLSEGPARLILLPDQPPVPAPTCAYQTPLPATTPSALWLLEDHRLGDAPLQMTLDRRADGGWQVTTRWQDHTTDVVFWLHEEADRPQPLGFPAPCPGPAAPHAALAQPLLAAEQTTARGRRGRVLQPAPLRDRPAADGALLALLPAGATVSVVEVTDTLRAVPGTGMGHPDAYVRLADGREGWIHLGDMAVSADPPEEVGARGSGLWLAQQPGMEWWGKLADFERDDSRTWLVGAEAAVSIARSAWTGSSLLREAHLHDDDGDRRREVLVVTAEYVPEVGLDAWMLTRWVEPTLAARGQWTIPIAVKSGLTVSRVGQARVAGGQLVLDTADLKTATGERKTVYLDDPSRAPEVEPLPLRATVRRAVRAHAAPSATATGQGTLREGEAVELREVYGGPLDAWRQPGWVRTDAGWLPVEALDVEAAFLAVTLAGEDAALEAFSWVEVAPPAQTGQ